MEGSCKQLCRTFEISPFANEDRLNLRTVGKYSRRRLLRNADEKHQWALQETKEVLQSAAGAHTKQKTKLVAEKVISTLYMYIPKQTLTLSLTIILSLTLCPYPAFTLYLLP